MLQAAGVDTEGPMGAVRVAGLAGAFTRVFHTWLDDTDPGMARTMASLDRQLRSGERTIGFFEGACSSLRRMGDAFRPGARGNGPKTDMTSPPPSPL
jgi:hypothetical protein